LEGEVSRIDQERGLEKGGIIMKKRKEKEKKKKVELCLEKLV